MNENKRKPTTRGACHKMKCQTHWCLTLCNPMDHSPPGSSVHGILLARTLECSFLQGIFPTQGSNSGLPDCRHILYHLSNQGSPLTRWAVLNLTPFSTIEQIPKNKPFWFMVCVFMEGRAQVTRKSHLILPLLSLGF